MTATEVKAKILGLLDHLSDGDVEITKHGRVVARLTAAGTAPGALRDSFAGVATSTASDEELFSTGQMWNAS